MTKPAAAALVLCVLAAPSRAATLRPMTTLHSSVVKLSDLFEGAGRDAARVLGPAPPPGGRIVVEARQLGAIAREFGVDWRPQAGDERTILERPGRILAREDIVSVLTKALLAAGAPDDAAIEVSPFAPPVVPADGKVMPVVTHLDYDATTGRFAATFEIADGAADIADWRVSGHAIPMLEVPVAVARLLPGTVLQVSDLRLARLPAGRVPAGAVRHIEDAIGKQLRYQAAPGTPLLLRSLSNPELVKRNARVLVVAELPGLSLSLEGRALQAGGAGDHVRILNIATRAVLDAEVIGDGRVRVDPRSPPLEFARPGYSGTEYYK